MTELDTIEPFYRAAREGDVETVSKYLADKHMIIYEAIEARDWALRNKQTECAELVGDWINEFFESIEKEAMQ